MRPLYILLSLAFACLQNFVAAQKLPKIQSKGVWAPQNIKIDGKLNEWNNVFQAYNSGQHIRYTIANNSDNLYFIAQMDDFAGTRKIFRGGIDLTITSASDPSQKILFNFPVISQERNGILEHQDNGPLFAYNSLQKNKPANKTQMDALVLLVNKEVAKAYKYLYVTGIPEIADTMLSVYNAQGIIVAAGFDANMRYTYELAIPLKYLQVAVNDTKSLKYNIKLRTLPRMVFKSTQPANIGPPVNLRYLGPGSIDDQFMFNDTDFSGEYILAPSQ